MNKIVDRFLSYTQWDTQSDDNSTTVPSTAKQLTFAEFLKEELIQLGLSDVHLTEQGYLYATLPSNMKEEAPTLGLIAHMDTSPDMAGGPVKYRIVENYDGEDIMLNEEEQIVLSPKDFPEIRQYVNNDIIVTDGKTLLGADDKAGIAAIVTTMEYFINHPDIEHGKVRIGFTPDEEIGRGADHFDIEHFDADFAFTVDGGAIGELEYENFNAASAKLSIQGRNIHPGSAKDKMMNALVVSMELHDLLPKMDRPEHTEHREGFFLLTQLDGTVDSAQMNYIIRDHDKTIFEYRKETMRRCVTEINRRYPDSVTLELNDSYYNMREKIEPHMEIVELAKEAMNAAGVTPQIQPIRGGTDGAALSWKGLPCPNLFTGGMNYHGRYEYLPISSLIASGETVRQLVLKTKAMNWEK